MSSAITKRPENFKSKIPVPVFKVNSSIKSEVKKEICKKISVKPETSSTKPAENCLLLLRKNCNTQLAKPTLSKINEVCKSQSISTGFSNKTFPKNYNVSRKPKEKYFSYKENKHSNKANKEISSELFMKTTERNLKKGETKKGKPPLDQKYESSNASLPASNVRGIEIGNKHLSSKKTSTCASENMLEKIHQEKFMPIDFSAQKDIQFESNEIFRQMILRGRQLSPSVCKLAPGVKLSSVTACRPSAYDQVFEVHPDPHKYAVEAIEKMSAKCGYRKLSTQIEKMHLSPFKIRNSIYTPGVNPEEEVMKSLKAIRAKRIQKSALKSEKKKVTFNSNIEEFSAKIELSSDEKSFANSEDKLTEISEGSSENTPSSPVRNVSSTNDSKEKCLNSSKLDCLNKHGKLIEQDNSSEHIISSQSNEDSEINSLIKNLNVLRPGETSDLLSTDYNKSIACFSKKISSPFVNRNSNYNFVNEVFSCQKAIPQILSKCTHQSKQRTTKMKLCTPQPISFSSNSRLLHNTSPDFLEERNLMNLSNLVPIYTPLVLKSIAKQSSAESPDNLSPVKLKLNFAAAENDTPKKEKKIQVSSVKNIVTATKRLDHLADKECDIFLSKENCPVVCSRYLQNPVALTLTEGDEMHFVPIRL